MKFSLFAFYVTEKILNMESFIHLYKYIYFFISVEKWFAILNRKSIYLVFFFNYIKFSYIKIYIMILSNVVKIKTYPGGCWLK